MLQQEEGWPFGLHPINGRVGFGRNGDNYSAGSVSFNTLFSVTSPTSSTHCSSDFDTQSTGSFFHDRSITLGSLIGVSSLIDLSRSTKLRKIQVLKENKTCKPKAWIFSLCSRQTTDAESMNVISINNTPSLGHFLAAERRAVTRNIPQRGTQRSAISFYGPPRVSSYC